MTDPTQFSWGVAAALFCIYFILDAINSYFTIKVISLSPWTAASSGCTMHFFIAMGVVCYVNNFWYLIPMMMGSWLGIFTLITIKKRYAERQSDDVQPGEGQPPMF